MDDTYKSTVTYFNKIKMLDYIITNKKFTSITTHYIIKISKFISLTTNVSFLNIIVLNTQNKNLTIENNITNSIKSILYNSFHKSCNFFLFFRLYKFFFIMYCFNSNFNNHKINASIFYIHKTT